MDLFYFLYENKNFFRMSDTRFLNHVEIIFINEQNVLRLLNINLR